jgi:hypothetical protein
LLYTPKIIHRLTHVKAQPPLAAIKGEAGHPSNTTTTTTTTTLKT